MKGLLIITGALIGPCIGIGIAELEAYIRNQQLRKKYKKEVQKGSHMKYKNRDTFTIIFWVCFAIALIFGLVETIIHLQLLSEGLRIVQGIDGQDVVEVAKEIAK